MYCISINHKNAPSEVRGRFALTEDKIINAEKTLAEHGIAQSVIVCTCNRTELYFVGEDRCCADTAAEVLAECAQQEIGDISVYLRTYYNEKALRHLFRVTCGIDSMIIGEDEILRQIKEAYSQAHSGGFTGFELNTIFQSAIACAKRIKTDTALSKTPVSWATLAANEASALSANVNVLMIGASGKIGSSALKNLLAHRNVNVTATVRAKDIGSVIQGVRAVPYSERYKYADEADCIISATASPHYTLTAKALSAVLKTPKPRLLIDLAVPPDIERSAASLSGVRLMNIDDFGSLAEENNSVRLGSIEQAEEIISEDICDLQKKLAFHDFMPFIGDFRSRLSDIGADGLLYLLRDDLGSAEFSAVLEALKKTGGK